MPPGHQLNHKPRTPTQFDSKKYISMNTELASVQNINAEAPSRSEPRQH